jgi:enoyl-CoA hydratase
MSARITTTIETHDGARVARIVVDYPAKLNVIGPAATRALTDAIAACGTDPTLRAVVLAGAGERAFIGGADINEMATFEPVRARAVITGLHDACEAIRTLPVPVIARMQGYTLGAGLEIAAACDMRVAGRGAKMGMPEVRVGIPSVIEAALLPMLIGWGRTRRLLLTAETIDAATALAWGLVEEVVDEAALDEAIGRLLSAIAACGPRAIALQKSLMRAWEDVPPSRAIGLGIDCFAESWTTPEPAERMAAFLAGKKKKG